MTHLLDSDVVADLLNGEPVMTAIIRVLLVQGSAVSVLGHMEVLEGARGSRDAASTVAAYLQVLSALTLLPVTTAIAERAAGLRLELRAAKRQVNHRVLDILVAATAIEHDLALVTRNRKHYDDIPHLKLYVF